MREIGRILSIIKWKHFQGANVEARDVFDRTPLYYAVCNRRFWATVAGIDGHSRLPERLSVSENI